MHESRKPSAERDTRRNSRSRSSTVHPRNTGRVIVGIKHRESIVRVPGELPAATSSTLKIRKPLRNVKGQDRARAPRHELDQESPSTPITDQAEHATAQIRQGRVQTPELMQGRGTSGRESTPHEHEREHAHAGHDGHARARTPRTHARTRAPRGFGAPPVPLRVSSALLAYAKRHVFVIFIT